MWEIEATISFRETSNMDSRLDWSDLFSKPSLLIITSLSRHYTSLVTQSEELTTLGGFPIGYVYCRTFGDDTKRCRPRDLIGPELDLQSPLNKL